jgi:GntR family transcriptional regulator
MSWRDLLVRINAADARPLYVQTADQLRGAIARGDLDAGDRLPPARALADALAINVHTVLRAYAQLRDEGLVEMRRGRTVTVLGGSPARAGLVEMAAGLVYEARRSGLDGRQVLALVEEQL